MVDPKNWGDLDTRQWWFGVLVVATPLLIGAVSTGHVTASLVSAGVVTWAFGEWVQHPVEYFREGGKMGNRYPRKWSVFGVVLNLIGVGLVAFAVYRFYKLGGRIL